MKDDLKPYKIYHRGYKNIEELYDDLKDISASNIFLEDNVISVKYESNVLEIKMSDRGWYYTYFNGNKDYGSWDDQDLYPYVSELLQKKKNFSE